MKEDVHNKEEAQHVATSHTAVCRSRRVARTCHLVVVIASFVLPSFQMTSTWEYAVLAGAGTFFIYSVYRVRVRMLLNSERG